MPTVGDTSEVCMYSQGKSLPFQVWSAPVQVQVCVRQPFLLRATGCVGSGEGLARAQNGAASGRARGWPKPRA
jgi:hypothetical protein